jgi:hypothetical protein
MKFVTVPENIEAKFPARNCPVFLLRRITICKSLRLLTFVLMAKPAVIQGEKNSSVGPLLNCNPI